jgi:4-hydroxy-4-methyl-2-oxoglutarate aldolase
MSATVVRNIHRADARRDRHTRAPVNVRPGHVVVADDDGVVVVPRLAAATVAKAGEEREKNEAGNRARLQKGELGLDIYDMRKSWAEKGLKYVDGPLE